MLTIVTVFFGIFKWTLIEYILHRFLFHSEEYLPNHRLAFFCHFLLHGIHHAFPWDPLRLVFPITMGYSILCFLILPYLNLVFPEHLQPSIKIGLIIGYILYDEIHYFSHHASPKQGYLKYVKMYHMAHHYRDGDNGYGVSQKFWDVVFNTELKL